MSKFLSFESDPVEQTAASDPMERQTWCALRIRLEYRTVSRIFDRTLNAERSMIYVPAFPLVDWIVRNWWSLFNESSPWESTSRPKLDQAGLSWSKRHCLRSADSALLLPRLFIFFDGRSLRAEWHRDIEAMPNMPGAFIDEGEESIDPIATQEFMSLFINETLARITSDRDDVRFKELRDIWTAIQSADADEKRFCILAGRMGIDPYDPEQMTDDLASFLEITDSEFGDPLLKDITEIADSDSIRPLSRWVKDAIEKKKLEPVHADLPFDLPLTRLAPPEFGYQMARKVREVSHNENNSIKSVEMLASILLNNEFRIDDLNHVPDLKLLSLVGQDKFGSYIGVGPRKQFPENQRFLAARCLYHVLSSDGQSQRLVTNGYSWDQKASRAFAAELLAPQNALLNVLNDESSSIVDTNMILKLSKRFNVSTYVVERQLENAGISRNFE